MAAKQRSANIDAAAGAVEEVARIITQIRAQEALAYLDALETDRKAALTLSEQKAEEARLIKVRQECFQTAMEILGRGISAGRPRTNLSDATGPITKSTSPCSTEADGRSAGSSCKNCRFPVRQASPVAFETGGSGLELL